MNSQSGKGGVGFMLEEHYGLALPRDLLVEFEVMFKNSRKPSTRK